MAGAAGGAGSGDFSQAESHRQVAVAVAKIRVRWIMGGFLAVGVSFPLGMRPGTLRGPSPGVGWAAVRRWLLNNTNLCRQSPIAPLVSSR